MRKISISSQIVILFILVLLASVSAFTGLTLVRIHFIAEDETFSRLITYSTLFDTHEITGDVDFRDMEVVYLRVENGKTIHSEDLYQYVNEDDLEKIINEFSQAEPKYIHPNKISNFEGKSIYYVISSKDAGKSFTLLLTTSLYATNLVKKTSIQLILVFLIISCLSILVIAIWGSQFARRLHRIQNHILSLPRNAYQTSYADDGLDEVGELSRAVEVMREEIKESERTKQEMLQNISHDFKTPIAVIKSYAEAQQDGMADEDSNKIIIAQTEILKNKVNRLLQYNSLEYLQKDREFEDVNMKEIVEEVIQGYKFQTNIDIELDLQEDVFFKGYRENYYTIVDNIVDNAKRYAKTKIKIVLKKDRLRIYNDGDPIDEQFIRNSFRPYEKGSKGEFGLGMSIVKKTVDFFGMQLLVKNEAIGVSFIITTPKN